MPFFKTCNQTIFLLLTASRSVKLVSIKQTPKQESEEPYLGPIAYLGLGHHPWSKLSCELPRGSFPATSTSSLLSKSLFLGPIFCGLGHHPGASNAVNSSWGLFNPMICWKLNMTRNRRACYNISHAQQVASQRALTIVDVRTKMYVVTNKA